MRYLRLVPGASVDRFSFLSAAWMEADRSFFPVDVSYLRYGSFPETALKLPLQQKMFFSPAWLSIYAVYFHRRIYERKPFEKTSLLPVGLFRDTFSDKRCDPSGLCTALVCDRAAVWENALRQKQASPEQGSCAKMPTRRPDLNMWIYTSHFYSRIHIITNGQFKMISVCFYKTFFLQLWYLRRHCRTVNAKIIRQLLPVKRNIKG